jgi:hypothetical protein
MRKPFKKCSQDKLGSIFRGRSAGASPCIKNDEKYSQSKENAAAFVATGLHRPSILNKLYQLVKVKCSLKIKG